MYKLIHSLYNQYEIDEQGNIRNSVTKRQCKPQLNLSGNAFVTVKVKVADWQEPRLKSCTIGKLLNEVFGFPYKPNKQGLPVSINKGGVTLEFSSQSKAADFIFQNSRYSLMTISNYLKLRQENIAGWNIIYHEEDFL
jgi:hypothetical protein